MGGGDSSSMDDANQLAQEQINMQKQELERKTANLFQTRLAIIKSQGAQVWVGAPTRVSNQ